MSTVPIILIGAGGHSQVLLDALQLSNSKVLGLTDLATEKHGASILDVSILGSDELILNHSPNEVHLVNGVASADRPALRRKIFETWTARGYKFVDVIHPASVLSSHISTGQGTQIMAGAIVQSGVSLGDNTILNTGSQVDHDCRIGSHTHVSVGATLCGHVCVGHACHVGAGATIVQGITIGEESVVGAGSVVIREVRRSLACPRTTLMRNSKETF